MQEMQVQSLGREDPLEEEMVTHSSILVCRIPRTEEPGRLQSMELQRVEHNSATKQHAEDSAEGMNEGIHIEHRQRPWDQTL